MNANVTTGLTKKSLKLCSNLEGKISPWIGVNGLTFPCVGRSLMAWAEPTRTLVLWSQGFKHPARNECMGWFTQIILDVGNGLRIRIFHFRITLCCVVGLWFHRPVSPMSRSNCVGLDPLQTQSAKDSMIIVVLLGLICSPVLRPSAVVTCMSL